MGDSYGGVRPRSERRPLAGDEEAGETPAIRPVGVGDASYGGVVPGTGLICAGPIDRGRLAVLP